MARLRASSSLDDEPRHPAETAIAALQGRIAPVRVSAAYQCGLLAVALVLLLLPTIYMALIGLVVYGLYLHVVYGAAMLSDTGSLRASLAAYLLPMGVGVLLIVFMIKPLFAKRGSRSATVTLSRVEQRHLYTFVDRVCEAVGAPKPYRIDVDCQVNASASFRDGLRGMMSRQLVLTIGLPLAAGLSLREFAGILAHEFGHFSQGTAMRLTFVVRWMNAWFARVVYERDAWDQWLMNLGRGNTHWMLMLISLVARLMVWITRRILWLLMMVAQFVSALMLRQMEFDADRHEARLAGGTVFANTTRRVAMLGVASNAAFNDLSAAWREKRLCDDLPRLVVERERSMPADVRLQVNKHLEDSRTRWFNTHPSDAARAASAARENTEGIFQAAGEAHELFHDFEGLSRRVTELFYRQQLGPHFSLDQIIATESLVSQRGQRKQAAGALHRVFQGLIHPIRPIFPSGTLEVPAEVSQAASLLLEFRNRLLADAPVGRAAAARFEEADGRLQAALIAEAQDRPKSGTPNSGVQAALTARAGALAEVQKAAYAGLARLEIMRAVEARQRKKTAAAALAASAVAVAEETLEPSPGTYQLAQEEGPSDALFGALAALGATASAVENLRREYIGLRGALKMCQRRDPAPEVVREALRRTARVQGILQELHGILRRQRYPYEHSEKGASISRYAADRIPAARDVGGVCTCADTTLQAVYTLYARLLGHLAERLETFEAGLGLAALPDPPDKAA